MKWIREILTAEGLLSSKRVCGVLGFIVCTIILCYCTYKVIEAPTMIDMFLISCCGLLGVDSITSIWKGKNNE